jgi:hypothetical protein
MLRSASVLGASAPSPQHVGLGRFLATRPGTVGIPLPIRRLHCLQRRMTPLRSFKGLGSILASPRLSPLRASSSRLENRRLHDEMLVWMTGGTGYCLPGCGVYAKGTFGPLAGSPTIFAPTNPIQQENYVGDRPNARPLLLFLFEQSRGSGHLTGRFKHSKGQPGCGDHPHPLNRMLAMRQILVSFLGDS